MPTPGKALPRPSPDVPAGRRPDGDTPRPPSLPWPDPQRLRELSLLLAMPADDSIPVLRAMGETLCWLKPVLAELESLPLERWQAEHTRLFLNGYPRVACPPFASAYRQGQMGGSAVGDLQGLYRRAGLQATDLPADYLGTLLECAAFLLESGDHDDLLKELWQDHLAPWLPRFACDLAAHAQLGLYAGLAQELQKLWALQDDG